MVEAFKVLSKNNIMHRDLKPDNILMHNGKIKLGDFGFCKPLESATEMACTMLGSPIYMAPEVLKGETYNRKADIWSLGVVLFQMIFGKCPFESKSIAKLIKLLDEEELIFPESPKISTTIRDLSKRMLVKDHTARIDWPDIFEYVIT
jgi:serine/threonine-protein kinase ULK/ATG1